MESIGTPGDLYNVVFTSRWLLYTGGLYSRFVLNIENAALVQMGSGFYYEVVFTIRLSFL